MIFSREAVELVSPLPLEECRRRLHDAMDHPMRWFGKKPVIGRVGDHHLTIHKRLRYRNSFQTFLRARVEEAYGRTQFHCRVSMHPFAFAFMTLWFGFIGFGGIVAVVHAITVSSPIPSAVVTDFFEILGNALIPAGMFLFGIGMVAFSRYLARGERQFLIDFLKETVEAEEAEPTL